MARGWGSSGSVKDRRCLLCMAAPPTVCEADRYASVEVPVRFLLGESSPPAFRSASIAARAAIPGSELVELPGQAHTMIDSDPHGFVMQVLEFFDGEG
jgi:pimeloyl-ACP methyl ester carboxylesterase